MEERDNVVEKKPPKNINVRKKSSKLMTVEGFNLDDLSKRHHQSVVQVSPRCTGGRGSGAKTPQGRLNCLCSPTTHAGSFRCRHHRNQGLFKGGSVGSNLHLLGSSKSTAISDSFQGQ